jgi:putative inorganic carbon (hco3(-)) transporter
VTTTQQEPRPAGREPDDADVPGGRDVSGHARLGRSTGQLLSVLAAVAAAAVAVSAGLALAAGDRRGVVLPLAVVAGVAVGVLAMTRFSGYVMLMLAVRPLLDVVKLSGPTAGRADTEQASRLTDPSTMVAVLFLLAAGLWLAA